MASGDSVQQIKDRLTIVDVVAPYVELQKAGKNYKGKSPFTNEKTPSFYVSPDRGMYYCFSTSQGGDIFTFVEVMEGVDFKGALKILAEKAGVELVPEDPKKKTERERQYDVLNEASGFFEASLAKKPAATDYLTRRGVKPETIAKWRIGYAPGPPEHGWRETKDHLAGKQFTREELQKAGLIKGFDTGKEPYDLFRDRIMFPIFDASGRVVAFSGRILSTDSEAPKYVNSPETELFNKSEILYGYDRAKQGIRHYDFALIVEGQFDVVMTHQAGYHNAVAVSGTALTPHHVMLLQRLSNRVVLALDADRAGIAAVKRAAELMLARGMDVKVARMSDGKDPADIIASNKEDFKKTIGQATHVIEYLLDVLAAEGKDERTFKLKAREEILPYVARIPNRIDQEHFIAIIATRLQTTPEAITHEVNRVREKADTTPSPMLVERTAAESNIDQDIAPRRTSLIQYLVSVRDLHPEPMQAGLTSALEEITGESFTDLQARVPKNIMSELLFTEEGHLETIKPTQQQQDLLDLLNELYVLTVKEQLRTYRERLRQAELAGEESVLHDTLSQISNLQTKLSVPRYTIDLFSK